MEGQAGREERRKGLGGVEDLARVERAKRLKWGGKTARKGCKLGRRGSQSSDLEAEPQVCWEGKLGKTIAGMHICYPVRTDI